MLTTTQGVVISVTQSKENDRIVKILSPELGLVEITARGAQKQNSSSGAATQLFACAKFCFNERRGRNYLNSCELVKTFYGLRLDIKRLSLASYFAEIIRYTVTERQSANDVYRLFMNCLYMLSEKGADCDFIKFIFELRITADLGMMPGLLGCAECYRSDDVKLNFLIEEGIFLCDRHLHQKNAEYNVRAVSVTRGMFEAMRFVCLSELDRIFSFKISDSAKNRLCSISEQYASEQLNRYFPTLGFYKALANEKPTEDNTNEQIL